MTIAIADPTLPVTLRSISADWDGPGGPQTKALTIAGNRFLLVIDENGPITFELPVTITASTSDGAGNVGSGFVTVSLRNPANFGCA